jgi:hypothetical protein
LSERSFLAGETETEFRFRTTNWNALNVIHHRFKDASQVESIFPRVSALPGWAVMVQIREKR